MKINPTPAPATSAQFGTPLIKSFVGSVRYPWTVLINPPSAPVPVVPLAWLTADAGEVCEVPVVVTCEPGEGLTTTGARVVTMALICAAVGSGEGDGDNGFAGVAA